MVRESRSKSVFSLYERDDVPVAVEEFSESAWADFEACCSMLDARVQQQQRTRSSPPKPRPPAHAAAPRANTFFADELAAERELPQRLPSVPGQAAAHPVGRTVEEVMGFVRANLRVCPQLAVWRRLYLMLPRGAAGSFPERAPLPIDRAGWQHTPDVVKQERLRQQIEWAQAHGVLAQVHEFLRCMREDEWHHIDPMAWPPLDAGMPAQHHALG